MINWSPNEESRTNLAAGISGKDLEGKWCISAKLGDSKQGKKQWNQIGRFHTRQEHVNLIWKWGKQGKTV